MAVEPLELERHADVDLVRPDTDDVGEEPDAFLHLGEGNDQRVAEPRHLRVVDHRERVERPAAGRHGVADVERATGGAARRRREEDPTASVALRQPELMRPVTVEEHLVVAVDARPRPQVRLWIWRGPPRRVGWLSLAVTFGGRGRRTGAGLELQDPEEQVADVLAIDGLVALASRDEETGAQRGLLLRGDVLEDLRVLQQVAGAQVARNLELAVDGDHADVAGVVEHAQSLAARVLGRRLVSGAPARLAGQAGPVPDVERRRRRDDAAVAALCRGLLVDVDRVAVAHRVAPVGDGRSVDRMARGLRGSLRSDQLTQAGGQIPLRLTLRRHARNISDEVSGNGRGAVAAA